MPNSLCSHLLYLSVTDELTPMQCAGDASYILKTILIIHINKPVTSISPAVSCSVAVTRFFGIVTSTLYCSIKFFVTSLYQSIVKSIIYWTFEYRLVLSYLAFILFSKLYALLYFWIVPCLNFLHFRSRISTYIISCSHYKYYKISTKTMNVSDLPASRTV